MHKRRRYLIEPRLQGRFILAFLSIPCFYVLLQGFILNAMVTRVSEELPGAEDVILPAFFSGLKLNIMITIFVLVPLTVGIGTWMTFRIAGPLYRFRQHLGEIAEGRDPGPCRIRSYDELQDLCLLINRAVDRLRADAKVASEGEAAELNEERQAA